MTDFVDLRASNAILDKIRMFEGSAPPTSPPRLGGSPLSRKPAFGSLKLSSPGSLVCVKDIKHGGSPRGKNITIEISVPTSSPTPTPSPSPSPQIYHRYQKDTETDSKIMDPSFYVGDGKTSSLNEREHTKELVGTAKETPGSSPRKDVQISPRTELCSPRKEVQSSPRRDPQSSPRTDPQSSPRKMKEKVVTLREHDGDDNNVDDFVKLNRLSPEEKQMIKSFVKVTKSKTKALNNLEEAFQRERRSMVSEFDLERSEWIKEMNSVQQDLAARDEALRNEELKSDYLKNMLRKANDELHDTQAAVTKFKRVLEDYKKNTDTELFNKSQTLVYLDRKLVSLSKLRESMDCVICEERIAKMVLNPCHHMVLCGGCASLVTHCPMCRSLIGSKFEVFSNWVV